MSSEPREHLPGPPASAPRILAGGLLMGLANLVPGISGGTMILAVGLYDRFIGAVADVTRLRPTRDSFAFLALLGAALLATLIVFSGLAVQLVSDYRWIMYSLFIGLTLGGVPELWRLSRPASPGVVLSALAGLAFMAALAWGLSGTRLSESAPVLVLVGAAAASSMILPGVSGSYVLLILGLYDTVIGSLSSSALREDLAGSLRVIVPVGTGAVLGIALLSNVLKWVLARWSRPAHAVLLGLLCGSVFGLWPFQRAVYPELADRATRKATTELLAGASGESIRAEYGEEFDDARLAALRERWEGRSAGELKALAMELSTFRPDALRVGAVLLLVGAGFLVTRALCRSGGREP